MFECPKNFKKTTCHGPRGFYRGYSDNGTIMCRVTDYASVESLLALAKQLSAPELFICAGCDKKVKEE